MGEQKIIYLQMIQEPITRMSTASAIIKGFAATIVAGVASVPYDDINIWVLALAFTPVLLFAILDIYYLKLEKRYRHLYEEVRTNKREVDFSLKTPTDDTTAHARVLDCIKSPSFWLFYPAMIAILFAVICLK